MFETDQITELNRFVIALLEHNTTANPCRKLAVNVTIWPDDCVS